MVSALSSTITRYALRAFVSESRGIDPGFCHRPGNRQPVGRTDGPGTAAAPALAERRRFARSPRLRRQSRGSASAREHGQFDRVFPRPSSVPAALAAAKPSSPRRSAELLAGFGHVRRDRAGSSGMTSSIRSTAASSRTAVTSSPRRLRHSAASRTACHSCGRSPSRSQWSISSNKRGTASSGTTEPALQRRLQRHDQAQNAGGRRRNARRARPRRAVAPRVRCPTARVPWPPRTAPTRSKSDNRDCRASCSARPASLAGPLVVTRHHHAERPRDHAVHEPERVIARSATTPRPRGTDSVPRPRSARGPGYPGGAYALATTIAMRAGTVVPARAGARLRTRRDTSACSGADRLAATLRGRRCRADQGARVVVERQLADRLLDPSEVLGRQSLQPVVPQRDEEPSVEIDVGVVDRPRWAACRLPKSVATSRSSGLRRPFAGRLGSLARSQ